MEESLLKSADLKATKKRQLLLSILQQENRAMTAEEVHEKATPLLAMNLSTVYRTLNTLTEKGILSKTQRKDKKAYYALEHHDHHHRLVCTVCKKTIPVDSCPLRELEEDLEQKTGFRITGHTLEFSGICPLCQKALTEEEN
ncbi:transcriptional repressor [Anaerotignum lactatifermentans]|uniref:Transcriptional repressor n=1 Tax=Anaerotignum lactatifermentans TaxID=160404 RepID=A0ABS2GA51_9FIRM|nr:transcriptional repressor [Anaerotignum lactatifermentans]MBM6829263.1 transcriptional repressor [Anaerotignum lactatifermentans]MBM6877497.1 transcriptional repressor [Anaerotignum lactatifermentans]MBM6950841.1 transcriptional repressor [Anaerotignum lactatifermentans]